MTAGDRNSMGLNYRRRVIYQALNEIFAEPSQVRRYFELWEREHSHEAHFVVTRYAAAVAKSAELDNERKSLFQRRLFHALTQPYESLPRVPDAWLPSPAPTSLATTSPAATSPAASSPPPPAIASSSVASATAVSPTTASEQRRVTEIRGSAAAAPEPVPASRFDSAERRVFRAFAAVLTAAILAKADRQPGVLSQAVDDLGRTASGREQELHLLLKRWSSARFKDEDTPNLRSREELRQIAHQLYLLAADLIGPVQADRLLAQATAEAGRLPEANAFSPQLLL